MSNRHLLCLTVMVLMVVLGLVAGCDRAPTPTPAATIAPGPTLVPSPMPSPTPAATVAPGPTLVPSPTSSPTPLAGPAGPLPQVLTRVPLAPTGAALDDLLLDPGTNRLYVTDTAGQLYVLDAATYDRLATLPAAGRLALDEAGQRLYVSPEEETGPVVVVDTNSLAVVGTVSPGGRVAVDSTRHRFYVGNRLYSAPTEDTPGVRVYDSLTLEKLGEVPQPGIPVYNPQRDELVIVAYTVYMADPGTWQITGDLLPDITTQSLKWCNGCPCATDAHVFADRNLLLVEMTTLSAGKGPGRLPQPRYFDATTLTELTDTAQLPALERACDRHALLVEPVDGRVYRQDNYSRYEFFNNLLVYDSGGNLITWRDGLLLGLTNPATGQMYVAGPTGVVVLDLGTLSPVGEFPGLCFHTLDTAVGRIYAFQGNDLVVLAQSGGEPDRLPPINVSAVPTTSIQSIVPSPDYAQDHTLFLGQGDRFYRSPDGGQSWQQLRGLPATDDWWTRGLSISPDFAQDRTLFAYGYRAESWGDGVYRSTDSGDTWQPMWGGLTHLRVYDVVPSPDYAQRPADATDGTVLAYARYQRIVPWESGYSVFRSTDRGVQWTLVMTQALSASPPAPASLLPGMTEPVTQFRTAYVEGKSAVERTTDGGQTWETVLVLPSEPYTTIKVVLPSPDFAADQTVYVLHSYGLLRSTDGGQTWQNWADERLVGRDYKNELTALALVALGAGKHQILIGTAAGELWMLDPAAMTWEPL
ncbi:MAG: hypothetical protein KKA73_23925 [Chloroflexi bacterium]|nr:hypothetical protein [Chloroflexota bacterium]MBU1750740.1 hypothetical protein [Chloroflexota bacterium]MBU1877350.1 hypothetical protein [Chloroflexota bacterium]